MKTTNLWMFVTGIKGETDRMKNRKILIPFMKILIKKQKV